MLKRHFEPPNIDGALVNKVFEEEVVPWVKYNDLKLLITDIDSKFHRGALCGHFEYTGARARPLEAKSEAGEN